MYTKKDRIRINNALSRIEDTYRDIYEILAEYPEHKACDGKNAVLAVASDSVSKNELILQLLEKIEKEKGGEIKEYENTMLCGKGKISITINVDYHYR